MYRFVFCALICCFALPQLANANGLQSAEAKVRSKLFAIEQYFRREALTEPKDVREAVEKFAKVLPNAGFDAAYDAAIKEVDGDEKAVTRVQELIKGSLPLVEDAEEAYIKYQTAYRKAVVKQQQAMAKKYQAAMRKRAKAMQQSCRGGGRSMYGRSSGRSRSGFSARNNPLRQMAQSGKNFERYLNRNSQAYKRLLKIR
jgi:hypothetical protein